MISCEENMSVQIIYATKYGSTKKIVNNIQKGLGEAESVRASEVQDLSADVIILGTPIYAGRFLPEMSQFLQDNREKLLTKKLFFFIVCADKGVVKIEGQETGGLAFLRQINDFLDKKILASKAFWGRMKKDELDSEDQAILNDFSNMLGVQFPDFDRVEEEEAQAFGQEIKEMLK